MFFTFGFKTWQQRFNFVKKYQSLWYITIAVQDEMGIVVNIIFVTAWTAVLVGQPCDEAVGI